MQPLRQRRPQLSIYIGAWSLTQWLKFIAILGALLACAAYITRGDSKRGPVEIDRLIADETRKFSGKVVGITDGDTIRVMHNGRAERIRLWGIDCPESRQPFGTRARQFTSDLAFGKVVTVLVRDVDRYGRTVGEVLLPNGRSLNHELVMAGLAW